ncbi:MAG: SARP family transcriptional [Actinobacteria bacterium]|nr:MAG: SARP family transcriptional [Actinomycetota bacterium]
MGDRPQVGVPEYGCVVRRERLLRVFSSTAPDLTLVVAPGGYGKTVLAAQFAGACPGECLWVSMNGSSPSTDDLPSALALGIQRFRELPAHSAGVADAITMGSGWEFLEAQLRRCHEATRLVVVDGLDTLETDEFAYAVLGLARRHLQANVRLVVTCRSLNVRFEPGTHDISRWVVERSVLEFSLAEVEELANHVLGKTLEQSDAEALCHSSTGQPALLLLLLRHVAASGGRVDAALKHAPTDVSVYLERSTPAETGSDVLAVLGVAAILGSGTVGQLIELSRTSAAAVMTAADAVPLLRLAGHGDIHRGFVLHDLACDVFARAAVQHWWSTDSGYLAAAAKELAARGDFHRLFRVLEEANEQSLLVFWSEALGFDLLEEAHLGLLESALDRIPVTIQVGSVRLLLLGALLKRAKGELAEAFRRVVVAQGLAESQCDTACVRECLIVEARIRWDSADYLGILPRLISTYDSVLADGDYDIAVLMGGYLASAHAHLGNVRLGREYALQHAVLSRYPRVRPSTRAQALQPTLFVLGFVCGDIATSIDLLKEAMKEFTHPAGLDIQCEANLAALLVETGRLREASRLTRRVKARVAESGLCLYSDACVGTEAAIQAALGCEREAETLMTEAIELAKCAEDHLSLEYNRVYRSVMRRACGNYDDALIDAEDALVAFNEQKSALPIMACLAQCEVAANLLVIGDRNRAAKLAEKSRALAEQWTAAYHFLRADMILAEIERQRGDVDAGVARIAAHADYIATESGNWQIAMYIRAFPGLLGIFCMAMGADALPVHMLRMVLPEYAARALDACADVVSREEHERLSVRLLGRKGATARSKHLESAPAIRVQLFGGMEVETPSGRITDKDWRKRKARLMFAIVVLQRGKDLPREQLFEHLWPEMTEERAKSNFYVIWSIMRRVLMGTTTGGPCPFVEHQAGVCRIVPSLVTSDVGDFEDALVAMRRADRAGDSDLARAAADDVAQYYRGELLPGEIYDDWLAPIRDRYRHDYGDAMLRAAYLHHEAGDTEKALHMIRAALSQDPWREDLYQAALRYLIHSGQRSGAIEIYTACRSKLADDLGLDPSLETRRLYDEILAMEDRPVSDTLL